MCTIWDLTPRTVGINASVAQICNKRKGRCSSLPLSTHRSLLQDAFSRDSQHPVNSPHASSDVNHLQLPFHPQNPPPLVRTLICLSACLLAYLICLLVFPSMCTAVSCLPFCMLHTSPRSLQLSYRLTTKSSWETPECGGRGNSIKRRSPFSLGKRFGELR